MSLVILNSPWGLWQLYNSDEPLKDKRDISHFGHLLELTRAGSSSVVFQPCYCNGISWTLLIYERSSTWKLLCVSWKSPWCAVIPVSRDASRAGASLESRSGGGRRESRVEVSLCHCFAAPTWCWLGSLLLPREKIRLRGCTRGQSEKHLLLALPASQQAT